MLQPMLAGPMFDPGPARDLLGVPLEVVVLALAAVLWFVGFRALMRITRGEPEVRSFRATAHREPTTVVLWAGTGVFAALAVVALVVRLL